jgi:hypothetical protein
MAALLSSNIDYSLTSFAYWTFAYAEMILLSANLLSLAADDNYA